MLLRLQMPYALLALPLAGVTSAHAGSLTLFHNNDGESKSGQSGCRCVFMGGTQ